MGEEPLIFTEASAVADLKTFVARAKSISDSGIRLAASGNVLACWVSILAPKLLGENTPTVLGLRTVALAEPATVDIVVPLSALTDRFARMTSIDTELSLPPTRLNPTWSAITPPRSGWQSEGMLDGEMLRQSAKDGIREVAEFVPDQPGALMVNNARSTIWSKPMSPIVQIPSGAAFAGYALGFWPQDSRVQVFSAQRWFRLTAPGGHVLVRPAVEL